MNNHSFTARRYSNSDTDYGFKATCSCGWEGREVGWWNTYQRFQILGDFSVHLEEVERRQRIEHGNATDLDLVDTYGEDDLSIR
jgi:hypothetical protein